MNNPLVTTSTNALQEHSIIGDTPLRIPTVGRIRSGIMVLIKAAQNKQTKEIYLAGVEQQLSWHEIGLNLKKATGNDSRMLVPKNVDYFTVRGSDFVDPAQAKTILELYGENRGLGQKLYKIPVIFPVDEWLHVVPHGLNHYNFNQRMHWSEYDKDGSRWCKQHAPAEIDEATKKAKRSFGGRKTMLRPENKGVCDPENCPEYQAKKCSLSGRYIFYVPGIKGMGAVEIPTGSFYSMEQARSVLHMVASIRRGRIAGLHDGNPIFYLTKKQEEVSMIDDEGKVKRVKQWLITLEANIEIQNIFNQMDALEADSAAVDLLENDEPSELDDPNAGDDIAVTGELVDNKAPPAETETPLDTTLTGALLTKTLRSNVMQGLEILDISAADFNTFASDKWGSGWGKKDDTLNLAHQELSAAVDNTELTDRLKFSIWKAVEAAKTGGEA